MRIVGGEWRGRRLVAPAGRATRPTSDRVREALFSTVEALAMRGEVTAPPAGAPSGRDLRAEPAAGALAGWTVLDLFAGSGALGLEALSRGAASCTFVERDAAALKALRDNLAALGCAPRRWRVAARDARRAAQADARRGNAYTLVLVDAPYAAYEAFERDLAGLVEALVEPGGLVAVETASRQPVRLPLREVAVKRYGGTQVTYLTRKVPCQRT